MNIGSCVVYELCVFYCVEATFVIGCALLEEAGMGGEL